jgi:HlyD family secretion protein
MIIPKDRSFKTKLVMPVAIGLLLVLVGYALYSGITSLQASVVDQSGSEIKVEIVERGELRNQVSAYGVLKSSERRSLVTQVSGTITELMLQPGSNVEKDSVIMNLVNPQLQREYESVSLEVQEAEAAFAQLQAELTDQQLTLISEEQMRLAELKTEEAELAAHATLAEQQIVSQLELHKQQMLVEQANLRYQLAQERKSTFSQTKKAKLNVGQLRLQRVQKLLMMKKADLDSLQISAGMVGVLQSLNESIQLGHWLSQGTTVGIVANLDELYAELRVSAADAANVTIGMPVILNIKGLRAEGEVTRVAPNVVRNQVQVDVKLTSSHPVTARPDVEVNAEIVLNLKPEALLLSRPAHFDSEKPLQLYVRHDGDLFRLMKVETGEESNRHVEIVGGLSANDQVLMADPVLWKYKSEIRFN